MKTLNLEHVILIQYCCKENRSILEFGVVVWSSGITARNSNDIERIQKICVNIILCDVNWEIPYKVGCTLLWIKPLKYRRVYLCRRFIQKASLTKDTLIYSLSIIHLSTQGKICWSTGSSNTELTGSMTVHSAT